MDLGNFESLGYILPELIMVVTILAVFLIDLVVEDKDRIGEIALVGTALALFALATTGTSESGWLFSRMIIHDPFAVFFKMVFAFATLAAIGMSLGSNEVRDMKRGEYYGLLLSSALGTFFMASAANLLMAYLSLEFVSITSYVLTGFMRHNRRSGEAALKYLIYGGVASGAMIYGMSWLFGLAGTMDFAGINKALMTADPNKLALFIGIILTLAGLGYKIAAAPFHMWAPDVYQGAPLPVTAFLSVGSKAGGFALLMRMFYPGLSHPVGGGQWEFIAGVDWPQVVLVLSMVTMTIGNLTALSQRNLKRMLAYSSIAHAGYMLMAFVVLTDEALIAMMFYIVAYYLMNIGAFFVLMLVVNDTGSEDIEAFRGLAWRGGAGPAVAMTIFLVSLIGLPPMAGFVGKFALFAAVIKQQFYFLATVGVLNSVVAAFYYFRVIRMMFLEQPTGEEKPVTVSWWNGLLMYSLSFATIVLGIYWDLVFRFAKSSVRFFVGTV